MDKHIRLTSKPQTVTFNFKEPEDQIVCPICKAAFPRQQVIRCKGEAVGEIVEMTLKPLNDSEGTESTSMITDISMITNMPEMPEGAKITIVTE